ISTPPKCAIGNRFLISNWWMGSIAWIKSLHARRAARLCSVSIRRARPVGRNHARRPHHVENTRDEAEQQKYDHSPRRNSEPTVEQPTERRTDQSPGDELAGEPKAAGNRR